MKDTDGLQQSFWRDGVRYLLRCMRDGKAYTMDKTYDISHRLAVI